MKKDMRDELKDMTPKELNERLTQLNADRMKLESKMYRGGGNLRTYPKEPQTNPFGNLKRIKKDIAWVMTLINTRK